MSRSDRGEHSKAGLIATGLVAILGVVLYWTMFYDMGFQSGYNQRQAHVEREHHASDTPKQVEWKCSPKTGAEFRECVTEIVEAERESRRSESDLAAQWKAADWVMWAGILAGAQLIATALGLYFVKRTLDATLEAVVDTGKATKAMERQNEQAAITQRPWLHIETIEIKQSARKVFGRVMIIAHIEIAIKNSGNTPALNVRRISKLSMSKSFTQNDQSEFFENSRDVSLAGQPYENIPPAAVKKVTFFHNCEIDDLSFSETVTPISICYSGAFGDNRHQTGQTYYVCKDAIHDGARRLFLIEELLDPPEIPNEIPMLRCGVEPYPGGIMT